MAVVWDHLTKVITVKEHLSASVNDGTIDKLRELAGGRRKVGEFLGDVVDLLWRHRHIIVGARLRDLVISTPAEQADRDRAIEEMSQRLEHMSRDMNYFKSVIESGVREPRASK